MLSMVMTMDMDMDVDGDGPGFGHVDGFDSTSSLWGPRASTGRAADGGDGRALLPNFRAPDSGGCCVRLIGEPKRVRHLE